MNVQELIGELIELDLEQPVFIPDGIVLVEVTKIDVNEDGIVVLT